jgi:cellulose synthase/poly-beta-1,6-N-acetylglucosamine synthase-like glycosyltransferase
MLTLILITLLAIPFSLHTLGTISLILKLKDKVWLKPKPKFNSRIAILIPLYRERGESIEKTLRSITNQVYDREKMRVLIIVEKGDNETMKSVVDKCRILDENNIKYEIIVHPESRSSKAKSLNYALKFVDEPFIVVYDADDDILDTYQIARGISLMNDEKYDSVGVKVLRSGNKLPQLFSYVETCLWVNIALPALKYITGYPHYSGEGLFVSTEAIRGVGGFPETLTEDSMLTVEFAKRGLRMALMDSTIIERGPYTVKSLIKQRMRWNRGLIQCFTRLVKEDVPLKVKIVNGLYYLSPISYLIISISTIYTLLIAPISKIIGLDPDPIPLYICIYLIVSVLISPLFLIITGEKIKDKRAFIIPFPMWIIIGLTTLYSLIKPRVEWYRTERHPAKQLIS